jgi:CheY-like chemotaxis protein
VVRHRLLIADDHEQMLKRVSDLLAPEFDIVATAADGRAAIEARRPPGRNWSCSTFRCPS